MPMNDSLYLTSLLNMQLIAVEPDIDETTGLLRPINLLGLSFPAVNFIFIDEQFDFLRTALHHDTYDILYTT
jgi:hypothetical protein